MNSKLDIVWYIVKKLDGNISHLKLQKLLYYVYSWSLVAHPKLFIAQFEAWKLGPVEKDIYHHFKDFGDKPIGLSSNQELIHNNSKPLLDFIINSYKPNSAVDLSLTTHSELPWKTTKPNEVISVDVLFSYYSTQAFAANFPHNNATV